MYKSLSLCIYIYTHMYIAAASSRLKPSAPGPKSDRLGLSQPLPSAPRRPAYEQNEAARRNKQ